MFVKYNYFGEIIYEINLLRNSLGILESEGLEVSSFKDELDSIYCEITDSIKTDNYDPYLRNEIIRHYTNLKKRVSNLIYKEPQIIWDAVTKPPFLNLRQVNSYLPLKLVLVGDFFYMTLFYKIVL